MLRSMRSCMQVGLVSQEPTMFALSIRENIMMGKPGATESEVRAAAGAANATIFIDRLPNGLDTQVGNFPFHSHFCT